LRLQNIFHKPFHVETALFYGLANCAHKWANYNQVTPKKIPLPGGV